MFGFEQLESRQLLAVMDIDMDMTAGFVLSGTSLTVSESGMSNAFNVALTAQPSTNVVLFVASGDPSEATVSRASLTFTSSNWSQPQWVMVAGVDDPLVDGAQATQITVGVDPAASDGSFADVLAQWVTVTTTDNDMAGFTVSRTTAGVSETGSTDTFTVVLTAQPISDVVLSITSGDTSEVTVSPAQLTFTPAEWNVPQTVTLTGVDDDVIDGKPTTLVAVSVVSEVSDGHFAGLADRTVSVSTFDNDFAGFTVNKNTATVAETGTTDMFTVVLTAQPDKDVVLTLTSADTGEVTVSPAALTFTPADWNTPQTVTVIGVDDDWDDGIQYTYVTVSVDTVASDPGFAAVDDRQVVVFTEDDDEAGLVINTTGVSVSENETTDTFTIHLRSRPETNVVLTVISADPDEATVSPTVLTFSPADWNFPKTVTVTGVDDSLLDGNQTTLVKVGVADNESAGNFATVGDQAVSVTTTDNDVAGFVLSKTSVTVAEAGSTDTFTIALTARPNSSVTLAAISGDAGEATVSPAVLTFAPDEWDVPQTVAVTGVDDPRIDGSQTTAVTVSVAGAISDHHFDLVAAQTVSVTTTDDDVAGFTLSKSIAIVSEAGTTETFSVVLTAQPESGVTLTVSSSDTGEATVSPSALVFSPGGWDSPQTVTITGANDSSRDGDQSSLVTVAVNAAPSDNRFSDVLAQTVSVTTTDDDQGWQNSDNPFDVSGDGTVDATDVLILINYVNGNSGSPTLPSPPTSPPPYYDVNNDGRCTAFDVLVVINFINNQTSVGVTTSSAGEGEGDGEGESRESPRSNAAPPDSPSEPASVPSGDVQLIPAPYEQAASDPVWFSTFSVSTVGRAPSGLAEPTVVTRAVLEPAPVAPLAALDPIDWAVLSQAAEVADDQWIPAVDASLGDWEPGWRIHWSRPSLHDGEEVRDSFRLGTLPPGEGRQVRDPRRTDLVHGRFSLPGVEPLVHRFCPLYPRLEFFTLALQGEPPSFQNPHERARRVPNRSGTPRVSDFVCQPLAEHHDRLSFRCGAAELDDYLQRRASQDTRRRAVAVFVLIPEERTAATRPPHRASVAAPIVSQISGSWLHLDFVQSLIGGWKTYRASMRTSPSPVLMISTVWGPLVRFCTSGWHRGSACSDRKLTVPVAQR